MTSPSERPATPMVATVVVSYNNLADTRRCLTALRAVEYPDHRMIVVDNGSDPSEADTLREWFGGMAEIIRIEGNRGYAPGANAGIRLALEQGAEFVWLMNNDAAPEPRSLRALVDAATEVPGSGLLSPVILAPKGPEAPDGIWYAGGEFELHRARTRHIQERPATDAAVETRYITGCAMLVRSAVFREVGLLRNDLYLYWEDADLNLRATRAGWNLLVVPTAIAFHYVHGSIPSKTIRRYFSRNALWVLASCEPASVFLLGAASLGVLLVRLWGSALLRRRERPFPETLGFLEGLFGAPSARVRARHPEYA